MARVDALRPPAGTASNVVVVSSGVSSFASDVGSVPGAEGVSADHQCIVWCNQVVRATAEGFLDVAAAT